MTKLKWKTGFSVRVNFKIVSQWKILTTNSKILCNSKNAQEFSDGTWVEITGKITKGDYHGDIPVIDVEEMKFCVKPQDEYVYPPDDMYIPTSALF